MNGPCAFLGAYRDPNDAQRKLEKIINITRYGSKSIRKSSDVDRLYDDLISQGDGEPAQLPYEMMNYLLNHLHLYKIDL
jgi:hypothetical protein